MTSVRLATAMIGVLVLGCASADEPVEKVAATDEASEEVQPEPEPEPEPDPEPEPEVTWNPGSHEEFGDLVLSRVDATSPDATDDWLAWLDCRNPSPSSVWDFATDCFIPVDGELVAALHVDWLLAFDTADLDASQQMMVAALGRGELLDALAESACRSGADPVYSAPLPGQQDLVFLWADYSADQRYNGAAQVLGFMARAAAMSGFSDVDSQVLVLPC